MSERIDTLLQHHQEKTDAATVSLFQAPGRVNLLGEHTDYSGGFCMPAALSFNTLVAASPPRRHPPPPPLARLQRDR